MTKRLKVLVRGRVQGIGFRWFVRETAERLGVGGWVRNNPSGDVELEAQGPEETLEAFVAALERGHPYARVESLERHDIPRAAGEAGFAIRQ